MSRTRFRTAPGQGDDDSARDGEAVVDSAAAPATKQVRSREPV